MGVVEAGGSIPVTGGSPKTGWFPCKHFPVLARSFHTGRNVVVFFFAEETEVSLVVPPGVSRVQFNAEQVEQVRRGLAAMSVGRADPTGTRPTSEVNGSGAVS